MTPKAHAWIARVTVSIVLCLVGDRLRAVAPQFTEDGVEKFVLPGTPREAITAKFWAPDYAKKSPKLEDGSNAVDEIIDYFLHPNPTGDHVFSGFQIRFKDDKVVQWLPIYSTPPAAEEGPIPPPLKLLLPKITQGMDRGQVKEILTRSYPDIMQGGEMWDGQGGTLGFRLDERFGVELSAIVDRGERQMISRDRYLNIFDFVREIRYDLHRTSDDHFEIESSFNWGEASRKNEPGK